jgi:hypothetical protein
MKSPLVIVLVAVALVTVGTLAAMLQEQPTWVVRSDVYPTAPHKDRVRLTPVINLIRPISETCSY